MRLDELQDVVEAIMIYLREPVALCVIDEAEWDKAVRDGNFFDMMLAHHSHPIERPKATIQWLQSPPGTRAAPMSAAPFVMRDDGRPDWGSMWQAFCDLALHGGPPHRGEADALGLPTVSPESIVADEMIDEVCRGIYETTRLTAVPSPGGWLAIRCDSRKMAAWLAAVIILENVEARFDDDWLFVPGDAGFHLKDQVKSIITVVAKCHHYWQQHVSASAPRMADQGRAVSV